MHGTILILLRCCLQAQYEYITRVQFTERSGLGQVEPDYKNVYPDEHIYALLGHAAEMTGLSAGELYEKSGKYLVTDLMYMYQQLLQSECKTLDM